MITPMTTPYRTILLDRRLFALHPEPSAHRPQSAQGGHNTPLTRYLAPYVLGRPSATAAFLEQ